MNRRNFLRFSAACGGALVIAPRMVFANVETDRRFVFIIQRGAADGLNTVVPYAEPAYAKLRGALAVAQNEALKLDGTFALHPSLTGLSQLYKGKEALFVQAVASPYRERSHFDGQNVLETGGADPYKLKDGWLNRLTTLLPKSKDEAIAFAPTVPLALRGKAEVASFAPSNLPAAPDDLLMRVGALYEKDPQLHALWSAAMDARELAGDANARQDPASVGKTAGGFLARDDGPRIAMIETSGWDTHSNQEGRMDRQLRGLDQLIMALREQLGPVWKNTTVLVATEFGRTAAVNGTGGTDHGTAAAAMVIGGAVEGGRILADWPGLAQANLYEGRDLAPTLNLDDLIATVAAESLRLDPGQVARTLFPDSKVAGKLSGLVRA